MPNSYSGSCLCGDIKFSVTGFSDNIANCHCTMCRKFHGAAFGTLTSVEGLNWLSGKEQLKDFVAPNGTTRTFCKECGSSLGFRVKGALLNNIEIAVSIFDDDIPITVDAQIYTANKANWCSLDDQLPAFEEGSI
jgi:hypothetical protein